MNTPKVSRIRIRQNGLSYDKATPLARTLEVTTIKDLVQTTYLEVALGYKGSPAQLMSNMQSVYPAVQGEYVYIGYDLGGLAPDALEKAVAVLDRSPNLDAFAFGALPFGQADKPVFTLEALPSLASLHESLPLKYNPMSMLSLFVFRKKSFDSLLTKLYATTLTQFSDLSAFLHGYLDGLAIDWSSTGAELLTVHPFTTASTLLDRAIALLNESSAHQALLRLDQAALFGEDEPGIPYYKAMALAQLGYFELAINCAEESLRRHPNHAKSLELIDLIKGEAKSPKERSFDQFLALWKEAPGALSDKEGQGLYERVQSLPDDAVILELGTGEGRSTLAMAMACAGTNRKIFTVDLFRYYDDYFDVFQHSIKRFYLEAHVTPLIGNCHEIVANWGNKPPIDFVFIDADHEYESVRKDYELCYEIVKPGGWIGFHDITPSWGGPTRLWEEEAKHVLGETTQTDMFACGRKVPGKKRPTSVPPFIWHQELIGLLRDQNPLFPYPDSCVWALAMHTSAQPYTEQNAKWCLQADMIIGYAPDYVHQIALNWATRKDQGDANNSGYMQLWYGLIAERRGSPDKALHHFQMATKVSNSLPQQRVDPHIQRIQSGGYF